MSSRIFISHSMRGEAAAGLLRDLATALRGHGHRVLLDQDGLELGTEWRSTLNAWIGGCDVAIVLLSEGALQSTFVAYEVSILAYRAKFDRRFRLYPVLLDPVDYDHVESSALSPSRIHDHQSVVRAPDPISRLTEELAGVGESATPLDIPVFQLAEAIERAQISERRLLNHLESLGLDFEEWLPGSRLTYRLAISMIAAGLEKSIGFLRQTRTQFTATELRNVFDLLASSWVDYRAIRHLPDAARLRQPVAVNASDPLIAEMYVISASVQWQDLPPSDGWLLADVAGLGLSAPALFTGDPASSPLDGLIGEVRSQLADLFGGAADVDERLAAKAELDEPIFVALPAAGLTEPALQALRTAFPGVTFFVLTGPQPPKPDDDAAYELVFLRPAIEEGREERFCRLYKQRLTYLFEEAR